MSAAQAAASSDPDPIPGSGDAARKHDEAGITSAAASGSPLDADFGLDERAALGLCLVDPSAFDTGTVLEFLIRVAAEQSRLAAARARLLAELSARDASQDRWVAEEVGAALRLSPRQAMAEVKNSVQLHDQLPRMFAELAAGRATGGQARLVAEASYRLPHDAPADGNAVAGFDATAAQRCGEMSEPQTRQFLRRQVLRADPTGAGRRHKQAVADRHVRLSEAEDGMALLTALLPAPEAVACMRRLDVDARRHRKVSRTRVVSGNRAPSDARTLDQLRADLFIRTLLGTGDGSTAEASGDRIAGATGCVPGTDRVGLGASINVIVSAATLVGQDDEPGWLDRYGPISAETARRIAHDPTGTWRRLVTDPHTGQVTDVGNRQYRPPASLRRLVMVRDGTCRFPYCTHPATDCDLDHAVPWPQGSTALQNLHAVSRRHHRAKTRTRWRVTLDPDTGAATWISLMGKATTTRPPQRWTMPNDTPAQGPAGASSIDSESGGADACRDHGPSNDGRSNDGCSDDGCGDDGRRDDGRRNHGQRNDRQRSGNGTGSCSGAEPPVLPDDPPF